MPFALISASPLAVIDLRLDPPQSLYRLLTNIQGTIIEYLLEITRSNRTFSDLFNPSRNLIASVRGKSMEATRHVEMILKHGHSRWGKIMEVIKDG